MLTGVGCITDESGKDDGPEDANLGQSPTRSLRLRRMTGELLPDHHATYGANDHEKPR
jgi:hypothetical protein